MSVYLFYTFDANTVKIQQFFIDIDKLTPKQKENSFKSFEEKEHIIKQKKKKTGL